MFFCFTSARLSLHIVSSARMESTCFNETVGLVELDLSRNRLQTIDQLSLAPLANLTHLALAQNLLADINGLLTNQVEA